MMLSILPFYAAAFLLLQTECISLLVPQGHSRSVSGLIHRRGVGRPNSSNTHNSWWTWSYGSKLSYAQTPAAEPQESPTPSEPRDTEAKPNSTGTTQAPGSEAQRWLDIHNKFRSEYGAPGVTWSDELVTAAKRLTDTCVWEHTKNNQYGENMSAGQKSLEEVVEGWVSGPNEKDSYSPSNPTNSHFTQVVWVETTKIGCFMTECKTVAGASLPQSPVAFWGCEYDPAGNVIGQFQDNVKAAEGGAPATGSSRN